MGTSDSTEKFGLKRKGTAKLSLPRKKAKIQHRSADNLPWKLVSRPSEAGIGFDDGILEFEEVEGVEVIYETTGGGRVVKFNVSFISLHFYLIDSIIYQVMAGDEPEDESNEKYDDILQQEADQELVIEPIAIFDCTQTHDTVPKSIPVLIFGTQLKSYCLNGINILFIQKFCPHYMKNSFSLLHPFKRLLCPLLSLVGTS